MIKSLCLAIVLASGIAAAPAAAVTTFDAFTSFNGTQGAGGFTYGSAVGAVLTPFTANTNCFIAGSICLQAAANADVPGATKSFVTSTQYGGVSVPVDRLLVHPGPASDVYISFTAPVSTTYHITGAFSIQDATPSGIIVLDSAGFSQALNGAGNSLSITDSIQLLAGQTYTVRVNNAGAYGNDSTGVNLTLSFVPEPATWSMLIAGFAMTGFAMRRRKVSLAA